MAVYQWKGAGYGLPYEGASMVTLRKRIDLPLLIARGANAQLALVATPNTGAALASTGFAADDILEMFWVPKGTVIRECGVYVITGEGATCTINAGVTSSTETEDGTDIDGWGVFSLQTAGATDATTDDDGFGTDAVPGGELYITNGSVDVEFNHATDTAEFEFWSLGYWIGNLTANTISS